MCCVYVCMCVCVCVCVSFAQAVFFFSLFSTVIFQLITDDVRCKLQVICLAGVECLNENATEVRMREGPHMHKVCCVCCVCVCVCVCVLCVLCVRSRGICFTNFAFDKFLFFSLSLFFRASQHLQEQPKPWHQRHAEEPRFVKSFRFLLFLYLYLFFFLEPLTDTHINNSFPTLKKAS